MAASSKIICEEIMDQIPSLLNIKLHSLMPYLSNEDATTPEQFLHSELLRDYWIDVSNLKCGQRENKNHLCDIFPRFSGHDASTFVRLNMLNYIAVHIVCYDFDAHILLMMHSCNSLISPENLGLAC